MYYIFDLISSTLHGKIEMDKNAQKNKTYDDKHREQTRFKRLCISEPSASSAGSASLQLQTNIKCDISSKFPTL